MKNIETAPRLLRGHYRLIKENNPWLPIPIAGGS